MFNRLHKVINASKYNEIIVTIVDIEKSDVHHDNYNDVYAFFDWDNVILYDIIHRYHVISSKIGKKSAGLLIYNWLNRVIVAIKYFRKYSEKYRVSKQ